MADADALVVTGVTLVPAPGVGAPVGGLELRIDAAGITQLGGEPVEAWQFPWSACRDVRIATMKGVVLVALSFGALRYRWELPASGTSGGAKAIERQLQAVAKPKPMIPGVRRAKRRG